MSDEVSPTAAPHDFGLPRGVIIMLGLAATVIVVFGMRQVADILAPILLALVLTITVYPLRTWLQRHGVPRWLATLIVILGIYVVLIGLMLAFVLGIARLADILPTYSEEIEQSVADIQAWINGLGVTADEVEQMLSNVNYGALVEIVVSILSGVASVLSLLVFVIALVLFMGLDSAMFTTRMEKVRGTREQAMSALGAFALGTRKYFAVSTVFGGIVAVLDWLALVILGVPAALLWGILAFVTNYIPNVGFIIGVIPPALLALVTGGPRDMLIVILVYILLNFVIQSVIQPKYMGDTVGLTTTVTFLSLVFWAYILGPLGAILAVPMTLLAKAMLVDYDPDSRWLQLFLGDAPNLEPRKRRRKRAKGDPEDDPDPAPDPVPSTGQSAEGA